MTNARQQSESRWWRALAYLSGGIAANLALLVAMPAAFGQTDRVNRPGLWLPIVITAATLGIWCWLRNFRSGNWLFRAICSVFGLLPLLSFGLVIFLIFVTWMAK